MQQQRDLLKADRFNELDKLNLLDVMSLDMGNISNTLESHLSILLLHLLKYQYQTFVLKPDLPESKEFGSWYDSITHTCLLYVLRS